MSENDPTAVIAPPVARLHEVSLRYGKTLALDTVNLELPSGCMVGVSQGICYIRTCYQAVFSSGSSHSEPRRGVLQVADVVVDSCLLYFRSHLLVDY